MQKKKDGSKNPILSEYGLENATFASKKSPSLLLEILLKMLKSAIDKLEYIESGKLKNECAVCGLGPEWRNKELILVLDYINGIETDERIENLRLLCPNCNSQQYNPILKDRGMKKSNPKKPCERCGMPCSINADKCKKCTSLLSRKREWASQEELKEDMKRMGWKEMGRKYEVSDNTIRRWARKYGLLKNGTNF